MIHLRQPTREEMVTEAVRRQLSGWRGWCPYIDLADMPAWTRQDILRRIRAEFRKIAQASAPASFVEWVEVDAKTLPAEPWYRAWGPLQVRP